MQTPRLTMEAPSVPVSHYKSGVTQSTEDNGPPHLIKRPGLLPRVKAAIDLHTRSFARSLTLRLGNQEQQKAASRFARIIHPASLKVPMVFSGASIKRPRRIPLQRLEGFNCINPTHFKYPPKNAADFIRSARRYFALTLPDLV